MTTCIACESAEHEKYLPATHSAAECSAAFEWLRAEATREGASPHAGVALDEWHALAARQTRKRDIPKGMELTMRCAPTVGEVIAEAVAREREACVKVRDTVMTDTVLAAPLE